MNTSSPNVTINNRRMTTSRKHRLSLADYRRFKAVLWDIRKPLTFIQNATKPAVSRALKQSVKSLSEGIEELEKACHRDYPDSPPADERAEGYPDPFSDAVVPYSPAVERTQEDDEEKVFALRLTRPGCGDFFQSGDVFTFRAFDDKQTLFENDLVASLVNGEHWLIEQVERDHPGSKDAMVLSRFRAGYQGVTETDTVEIKGVFKSRNPENSCSRQVFGFPKGNLSRRIPITSESNQDMDRLRVACGHAPYFSES